MTRRQFLGAAVLALATPALARFQTADHFEGKDVLARILSKAQREGWKKLPMGEVVGRVGMSLTGTPYVGFTFEISDDVEYCVINLNGLDCATFYEAALAMARTIKSSRPNETEFRRQIQLIRYRGGRMDGYTSRLHYAIDYFFDNERKGIVKMLSQDLPGAQIYPRKVFFMSKNPDKYRQLKAHPEWLPAIEKMETSINDRRNFYLPKNRIADDETLLKTGDIIGLTTTAAGLDVSHTGMCYRDDQGVLRFLHASSLKNEVVLDVRLSDFLAKARTNDGIIVCRPLEL